MHSLISRTPGNWQHPSAAVDDLRLSLARHRRRAFRQDALALTLNEYGAQWLDVTSRQNSAMSRGCLRRSAPTSCPRPRPVPHSLVVKAPDT